MSAPHTRARTLSDGRGTQLNATRVRTPGDSGNGPHAAALRRQLANLAELEQTEVYQEMCAAADATRAAEAAAVKAGNGKVTEAVVEGRK